LKRKIEMPLYGFSGNMSSYAYEWFYNQLYSVQVEINSCLFYKDDKDEFNPIPDRMSTKRGRCCWVRTVSWMSWASWKIFHLAVRYPD